MFRFCRRSLVEVISYYFLLSYVCGQAASFSLQGLCSITKLLHDCMII